MKPDYHVERASVIAIIESLFFTKWRVGSCISLLHSGAFKSGQCVVAQPLPIFITV